MKPSRLTLLGLMGLIAVIGLFLAALLFPTPLLASIAWTGVLTILIVAALVAVLDPRRTFWVGFAVVGLIFAGFAAHPLSRDLVEHPLLTSRILSYLFTIQFPSAANSYILYPDEGSTLYEGFNNHHFAWARRFIAFHRIGQSAAALIHAVVGGVLALLVRSRLIDRARSSLES